MTSTHISLTKPWLPALPVLIVIILYAVAVSGHLIMISPVPFSRNTLNNSPLLSDGSDFPCKLREDGFGAPANPSQILIGEPQVLKLMGSVTHGGGSCQISLTRDHTPSKSSEWRVIKSIEGGCPMNVDGNLAPGPTSIYPGMFQNFIIPAGVPPGNYTLAWTWFNRLGNREMYMNCAPIVVIGDSIDRFDTFPLMFVANINDCMTTEGVDIRFPDPGKVVEYAGSPTNLASTAENVCSGTPTFE
ncbi:hypothetical protein N7523_005564 [Penicillium sp. IBT 18751x]|nr:hypothetical protein N7523_005850 [Penicillium sp. IBT 18751x]KAJ6117813.1 hypothetical protein N7523_005564 [Penicillium sp. IBT 18751x]